MGGSVPPIAVRVPASSANLGPGFDVLGMALDLYADVGTGRRLTEHWPPTNTIQRRSRSGRSVGLARCGFGAGFR